MVMKALKGITSLRKLYLSHTKLSEEASKELADVVKNNTSLEELDLSFNNLQSSTVAKILKALSEVSNLRVLRLSGNEMLKEAVEAMACVIKSNFCLEELFLSNNNLSSSAVVILQALQEISNLKKLNFSYNSSSGKVSNALANIIKNNSHLKELHLACNQLKSTTVVILQVLKEISNLKLLDLDGNGLDAAVVDDLVDVIKSNSSLRSLSLSNNNFHLSAVKILKALKEVFKVEHFYLDNNSMSDVIVDNLADMIKNNPCLEILSLSNNSLRSSVNTVLQALKINSRLKKLSLSGNDTSGSIADDLADVIRSNTSLEELCLSGNDLKSSVVVVFKALKEICNVRVLHLGNSNMPNEVAVDLANVITNNSSLEALSLNGNNLQSSVVVVLRSLKSLSGLKNLDLSDNNMLGVVVDDLVDAIRNYTCLEILSLRNSNLQTSVIKILQALEGISTLKQLNLFGNNMPQIVDQGLANVVKSNLNIEVLILGNNNNLQASAVIKGLIRLSNLKHLDLSNINLPTKAILNLTDVVSNNSGLEICL